MHIILYNNIYLKKNQIIIISYTYIHFLKKIYKFIFTSFIILKFCFINYLNSGINNIEKRYLKNTMNEYFESYNLIKRINQSLIQPTQMYSY